MKQITLIFIFLFTIIRIQAQEYQISFIGKGASTTVNSVKVENLTQGTSVILNGTNVLHLALTQTGVTSIPENTEKSLHIYPNPMTEYSIIEFTTTSTGISTLELFDITGKKMVTSQNILPPGNHSFKISGLNRGINILRIYSQDYSYVGQLVSNSSTNSKLTVTYLGNSAITNQLGNLKSVSLETEVPYNPGDLLLFNGISGDFSTIVVDSPTQSGEITFNFVPCTDANGNNYSVVQIGSQTWMAENLKTTKYQNGDQIPNITNNTVWSNLTTGAYCDYNNDETNSETYGHLYNWYAASDSRNVAPKGWHVPAGKEWETLANYLGTDSLKGEKLKETGISHWDSPNADATNETGFTGRAGGLRNYNGPFSYMGKVCYWWSATAPDSFGAWIQCLAYDTGDTYVGYNGKKFGYSLRCLLNDSSLQKNYLKINDTEYELSQGALMYYGNFEGLGVCNHEIFLYSPGININWVDESGSGVGAIVDFSIFNTKNKLEDGTYIFSIPEIEETVKICDGTDVNGDGKIDDNDCYHTLPDGKFYISSRISCYDSNINIQSDYYDTAPLFESGNVTIKIDGEKYIISFDCIGTNKDTIKGHFEGNLIYLDLSED
jgi:uncharacterized protein (TIGR02145 family)